MSNTRPSSSTDTSGGGGGGGGGTTEEEQKQLEEQLLKDAMLALCAIAGAVLVLKALAASITVYLAMMPLVFLYGINTCPSNSSFDAKQQLRMVLRGDQLPPDHPGKPKTNNNPLADIWNQAKAAIASELATLPGYEVKMTSLAGAATWTVVTMPTADIECYWLGCNHRWYYWGSKKLSDGDQTQMPDSATFQIGGVDIKVDFKKEQ